MLRKRLKLRSSKSKQESKLDVTEPMSMKLTCKEMSKRRLSLLTIFPMTSKVSEVCFSKFVQISSDSRSSSWWKKTQMLRRMRSYSPISSLISPFKSKKKNNRWSKPMLTKDSSGACLSSKMWWHMTSKNLDASRCSTVVVSLTSSAWTLHGNSPLLTQQEESRSPTPP